MVVLEDGQFVDAPHHDVMEGAGDVEAGLSGMTIIRVLDCLDRSKVALFRW